METETETGLYASQLHSQAHGFRTTMLCTYGVISECRRNNMLCNVSHIHCAKQIKRVTATCRFTTRICPWFSLTDSNEWVA